MAKTIIDSLVVTLGLDPSDFKKGTEESGRVNKKFQEAVKTVEKKRKEDERKAEQVRKKTAKDLQSRQKSELDGVRKLRNETLAFLSIFTAGKGLLSFAADTIRTSVAMGKMSENVGMSVNELGGWGVAMQKIGGTTEQATGMVDKAATAVAAFRAGMPDQGVQGLFTAAGGTGVNLEGAFKDTRSFMLAQADVVSALYKRDPKDAMLKARQMMGMDPETFNLLKQGREAVTRQVDAGARLSGMNKGQADAARRAMEQWVDMTTKLEAAGRKILFAILQPISEWLTKNGPQLDSMVKELANMLAGIDPKSIQEAAEAAMLLARAIAWAVESLAKMINLSGTAMGNLAGFVTTALGGGGDDKAGAANRAQLEAIKKRYAAAHATGSPGAVPATVTIGSVTVHTAATDAQSIARDMHGALKVRLSPLTQQANTGQH